MATQNTDFFYDKEESTTIFDQDFDHELSLRWQFVQIRAGKPLPFVLLPKRSRPPKHPKQPREDKLTEPICIIRAEIKSLYEAKKLQLNGCAPCQEGLAERLGKRWAFLHIGNFAPYPSNFSFYDQTEAGTLLGPMNQADHEFIAANELHELKRLITEDRYYQFIDYEKVARGRIKAAEARISELEVGMTRRHNALSKQFEIWAETIEDNASLISSPPQEIPDLMKDCGWHVWFGLERRLLTAQRMLEIERRAQHWVFCDMLAAMINGLLEEGVWIKRL